MKLKKWLALLLLPALLLTGCWADAPEEEEGMTLLPSSSQEEEAVETQIALPTSFALPYLPSETLNPYQCADGAQQMLTTLLYEGLFQLDASFTAQPQLCSTSSYDASALTWYLALRPSATFSDGTAVTPSDVLASWNLAKASPRYAARFSTILSYTATGDTIAVQLNRSNALLPQLLDIPIVKEGTIDDQAPVGTGPYVWSRDAEGSCLLANAAWQGGSSQPAARIALLEAKDNDVLLYQFASHEVQLITSDLTGNTPVSVTGNVAFSDADTTVMQYIGINAQKPLLQSPAVRRALSLGINRTYAVTALLSGHAKATQFPLSPVSPLYPKELELPYSHESFTSALIGAGLSGGQSQLLTLLVNEESSFKVSMARQIAAALSAGDLTVQVQALPWEEFQAALKSGAYDLYYGETRLTADWDIRRLAALGGSLNYSGFSNPNLDLHMDAFAATGNKSTALGLMRAFQEQVPFIPVCFKTSSVLVQKGVVDNMTPTMATPFYGLENWTLHLAEDGATS